MLWLLLSLNILRTHCNMSFLYGADVYIAWGVLLLGFIWFAYSDGWFNKSMWVSTESDEEE